MKAREPVSWPAPAPASAAGRTTIVPCPAISSPARAGPMMNAAWNIVRFSESAPGRSSGGTSRGMSACRAGLSNAEAAARSAFRAYRVSTVSRPAKVSAASAADSRAMHDWALRDDEGVAKAVARGPAAAPPRLLQDAVEVGARGLYGRHETEAEA